MKTGNGRAARSTGTNPEAGARAHRLIDAIADHAIYMLDLDGCVVSWNRAAERIKGYSFDEVRGASYSRFFTPEDRKAGEPEAILAEARAKGSVQMEGWRLRKGGRRFWASSTLHLLRDDDGEPTGFAKITRDMTEQRMAQEALIESERRFRYLVEGVVDYAIYMLDVNGVVTNWNKGAERIKLYGASDVVGRHFSIFYTPEDRRAGAPARALEQARSTGRFEAEGWRVRKDGARFWASVVIDAIHDDDGNHIGFAKITRDVSDKRAAQEALEASERQFRLLVAGVTDYALFMLDPNGVVANWNAGAERIKGYSSDQIVGQHMSAFYTAADRAAGKPMEALETARREGRYEAEAWRVRRDGSLFWANVVLDAIRDETGELIGFAKITRDATERRNAQFELQRANERLAQAQKMEAVGQLTGGVAHDFNNLLMIVGGQAHLLRRYVGDEPRALQALDAIATATARGRDLTRHLLTFARRQRLQPVPLSLSDRADSLLEILGAGLPSRIRLEVDFPRDLWTVKVDPGELELALLNLSVNARDAMPEGGRLSITAANVTLEAGDDDEASGEFVAITVRDTGEGIAPDILPRIFEPFFTTKDIDKGTGLGLSQVYGFAKQAGGRLVADSELGAGAAFTLYLPRVYGEAQAPEEAPAGSLREGICVLVVEDNPEVAEVAAALLEQLGARVRTASSARAALEDLASGEQPDLVFSDVVMAGDMDGLDLARRIREQHPGLPVLLATGYSENAASAAGEFPILAKPYEIADLGRAMAALLPADDDANLVDLEAARRDRERSRGPGA